MEYFESWFNDAHYFEGMNHLKFSSNNTYMHNNVILQYVSESGLQARGNAYRNNAKVKQTKHSGSLLLPAIALFFLQ